MPNQENRLSNATIQEQVISIVKQERNNWEDATAFITEKVAFVMRPLIRQLRKNFWGVFDAPIDPQTGKKKIWVPLTEVLIDGVIKNIDLDTKDINFRAKKPSAIGLTSVVRSIVKNYLDEMSFGEYLDEFEKNLAIDGTAVWKTLSVKEKDGEYCTVIRPVDLLNVYIDPTSHSIKEAYRFTERCLMTQEEVQAMNGWINTKDIQGTVGLNKTDSRYGQSATPSSSKYIDVWETWGKIPKSLITGLKEDENQETEGHLVVSGLDTPGKERFHLAEENKDVRPYEEAWYSRVPNRWYGKGIAEKVLMLQLWINTIVNIRINRATVSQLGLWKIRKGSGITPQQLNRLPGNGAIVVNNMEDLQQLAMTEASQASYTDENVVWGWSQRVTSAFDSALGENLPASTPATNAAISNQNSQSAFTLIKEQLGMFLQRWVKRQCLPTIFKTITRAEIIEMTGDGIKEIDEAIIYSQVYEQLEALNKANIFVDPEQIDMEVQKGLQKLSKMGNERFTELLHDLNVTDYDVEVYVTNEEFDKGVMTTNLLGQLQVIPSLAQTGINVAELATGIIKQAWDLMGLDSRSIKVPQQNQQMPNQNNMMMQSNSMTRANSNPSKVGETPTQTSLTASANTMESNA